MCDILIYSSLVKANINLIRLTVLTKSPLRVQFLPTFGGEGGGEEQEAPALLSKQEQKSTRCDYQKCSAIFLLSFLFFEA